MKDDVQSYLLPHPDIVADTYYSWFFSVDGERESVTYPGNEIYVSLSGIGQLTIADAKSLALALLASVKEAETAT